ncbi:MAG: helix-turn-helix domain-containing protein [Paludibacteraceae bacterium]
MKTKEKLMRDTGEVLRIMREKKSKDDDVKLTQNDIAEYAGLSVRYYNKMENGKTIPTIDTLMKIANAYKTTLSDICKQIEEY